MSLFSKTMRGDSPKTPNRSGANKLFGLVLFVLFSAAVLVVVLPSFGYRPHTLPAEPAKPTLEGVSATEADAEAAKAEQQWEKDIKSGKLWIGMTKAQFHRSPWQTDPTMLPDHIQKIETAAGTTEVFEWKTQTVYFQNGVISEIHDH